MNIGGQLLVGRQTSTSGRTSFGLAFGLILVERLNINTSEIEVFGVSAKPDQLALTSLWVLGAVWVSLLVHWLGDVASLGKYNSAMTQKRVETNIGGMNRARGRLEAIIDLVENEQNAAKLSGNEKGLPERELAFVAKELKTLKKSQWWHSFSAWAYLIGWVLAIPTLLSVYAAYLLLHA